jgi:hypothetical protein
MIDVYGYMYTDAFHTCACIYIPYISFPSIAFPPSSPESYTLISKPAFESQTPFERLNPTPRLKFETSADASLRPPLRRIGDVRRFEFESESPATVFEHSKRGGARETARGAGETAGRAGGERQQRRR